MSDQPASHSQPVVLSTSHRPEMSSFVPSNLNDELPTLPPVRNFIKSVPRMKRKKPIKKRQRFSDCLPTLPPAQDLIESVLRMERENIIRERQQQGLPIDDNTIDILIKQLEEDGRERAEESNAILKDTYNCSAIPISQPPARKCLPQPLIVPDTEPQSEATTLNPPAPNLPLAPLVPPFVARVDVIDSGPCLQWPSPVERKGYPVVDIRVLEDAYQLVTRRMKETIEKLPGRCSQDCVYPDSRLYRRLYNLLFAAPSFPVSLLRPLIAYSICGSDIHANIRQVLDVNPPLYNRHVIQFRSRKAAPGSHGVPLLDVFYDLGSLEGEANMPLLPIKDYINLSLTPDRSHLFKVGIRCNGHVQTTIPLLAVSVATAVPSCGSLRIHNDGMEYHVGLQTGRLVSLCSNDGKTWYARFATAVFEMVNGSELLPFSIQRSLN